MEYEIEAELFMNSFAIAPKVLPTRQLVQETMLTYCIISKTTNNVKRDLILIDAGAEYANYSSDMTRTIPVSGKYNEDQRVYNAVLRVKNEATKMLFQEIWKHHIEVGKLMTQNYWFRMLDKADVQNENPDWPA
jgi:Xaa-Pro aminopeptidase